MRNSRAGVIVNTWLLLPGWHPVIVVDEINVRARRWAGPFAHHRNPGGSLLSGGDYFWIGPFVISRMPVGERERVDIAMIHCRRILPDKFSCGDDPRNHPGSNII